MELESDVVERIRHDFPAHEASLAENELRLAKQPSRVARCIVYASNGSLEKFRMYIQMAKLDPRDVIVSGEYDLQMDRQRDLTSSFLIDCPEKFWIASIANKLVELGYHLEELHVGPDGRVATFLNGDEAVTVKEHNSEWSVLCLTENALRYGLDKPINNSERFLTQVVSLLFDRGRTKPLNGFADRQASEK